MPEAPNRTGRQITLNYGFAQLLAGGLCSYPLSLAAVGVPALIALELFSNERESALLPIVIIAAGIGVAVFAALGTFLGGRRWATWYAVLGLEAQPLFVVIRGALDRSASSDVKILLLPWAVAGAALALSFWFGRRHRGTVPLGIAPQGLQEDSA